MIRTVAIVSLSTLLLAVLYLPSAHSPERFLQQLRHEHIRTGQVWGAGVAERIMERMLAMHSRLADASPVPTMADLPTAARHDQPIGQEVARLQRRLFDNTYFRSIDALMVLAAYRAAALLEWLPKVVALALAVVVDALMARSVKAKEFRHHDPERFALHAILVILTLCGFMLALVWP